MTCPDDMHMLSLESEMASGRAQCGSYLLDPKKTSESKIWVYFH